MELNHARTLAHGRRDGHQFGVHCSHVTQPGTEDLAEGLIWRCGGCHQAHFGVELARPVVGDGVGFSQLIALAFAGHHMQKLGSLQMLDVLQRGDQRVEVMAVNRADVVKPEFFKQGGWHHHALGLLLKAACQIEQRRRIFQNLLTHLFGCGIKPPAHELRQIAVERTHRGADGHVVVVEDDQ